MGAKGYKAHGEDATFTVTLKQHKPGSKYKLELLKMADGKPTAIKTLEGEWKDAKTKDGVVISGATATLTWKAEGPPADGKDRSYRVYAQVTIEDDKGKKRAPEKSPELEVYNDWVEINAVAGKVGDDAGGDAIKNAGFKVLVNKRPIEDKKGRTGDDGKKKIDKLPGKITLEWEKPYKLSKIVEEKGTTLKAELVPAKRAKLLTHKGTSAQKPFKQWVNLPADAKLIAQGSVVKLKLKLEDGKAGEKIYVKHSFGAANSKRNDVKLGVKNAAVKPWAPTGGVEVEVDAKGEATVEVELGKAGGDMVVVEAGGTERCKDIPPVFLWAWRKLYYQLTTVKGSKAPNMADLTSSLAEACIDYEEVKADRTEMSVADEGMPDGAWIPSEALGAPAGQLFLVMGKHNRDWFHTKYFKKSKAPIQAHLVFPHVVTDFTGSEGPVGGTFTKSNYDAASKTYKASLPLQNYVIRYSLKTGNDSLQSGKWEEVGGENKGDITWDNLVLEGLPDGVPFFTTPAVANPHLASGKSVKISGKMVTHSGTYLGWSNGKDFQVLSTNGMDKAAASPAKAMAILMLHELGHALKQVVGDEPEGRIPPGMTMAAHGINYYNEGWHCAFGLDPAVYRRLHTGDDSKLRGQAACTCVMYGQLLKFEPPSLSTSFCKQCLPFLKARAVESLT